MPGRSRATGARNQVRIIAGRWRGRRIAFPDARDLRPTPDRVRETLFNWLQFELAGRRCLDLFAGSGALGFEAASRGAAGVVMVDADAVVVEQLRENASLLGGGAVEVIQRDAVAFLSAPPVSPFDIVFLDPPYRSDHLPEACALLERGHWLSKHARIYLETDAGLDALDAAVPHDWERVKSSTAGQVTFALYDRRA